MRDVCDEESEGQEGLVRRGLGGGPLHGLEPIRPNPVGDRRSLACDGRSFAYFVGAGLTENLSVFLTVVALGLGTVSVVTPLTSTAPIFVLLLSPLLLRGMERVTVRIVLGTVLIVLGVYLITALGR